jgi:cephalosporin hydroxylase
MTPERGSRGLRAGRHPVLSSQRMVRIGSVFRRAAAVIRSVRTAGVRATWLALRAWRHSANQKIPEFAGLIGLVSERELNVVLEIGTAHGGTYWTWCRLATPTAHLVSVDLPGNDEWSSRVRSYPRPTQTQTLIRADSHDPQTVRSLDGLRGLVDLLFIDGDHSYEGVRADFENYAPLVRASGLIAFHDVDSTNHPASQVDRFWTQLRDLYEAREIIDTADDEQSGRYGIGVLFWHGDEDLAKWRSTHGRGTEEPTASVGRTPPNQG